MTLTEAQNELDAANGVTYCDVCGRRDSWGCGHSASQRRNARRHNATAKHKSGRCEHYNHAECDNTCKLAGYNGYSGYAPLVKHSEAGE